LKKVSANNSEKISILENDAYEDDIFSILSSDVKVFLTSNGKF
jgi:hypothetical protein